MTNWSKYGLTDIPFLAIPAISISSNDPRANGRLFLLDIVQKQFEEAYDMITSDMFPFVFLRSASTVLGSGKSALLAALFWKMHDGGRNAIWATATDDPKIRDLLTRILDALLSANRIEPIRQGLGSINSQRIHEVLSNFQESPASSTVSALRQMLSVADEEVGRVYVNIKRRYPQLRHSDLFGSLIKLAYAFERRRFYLFIDQFEEFVRSHRTTSDRQKLSGELNDLMRSTGEDVTLVVSLHPEAEDVIREASPELETFVRVRESSVTLLPLDEEKACRLVAFYLRNFRPKGFEGDEFFPFPETFVRYASHRTSMNPRDLMLALRATLIHGMLNEYAPIDDDFVMNHHDRIFGGLENKLQDFRTGKFKYKIE